MTHAIAPIRVRPSVTPDAVSMVVARTLSQCTRLQAHAYLEAARGDVALAVDAWAEDHMHLIDRPFYARPELALEASE